MIFSFFFASISFKEIEKVSISYQYTLNAEQRKDNWCSLFSSSRNWLPGSTFHNFNTLWKIFFRSAKNLMLQKKYFPTVLKNLHFEK